MAETLFVINPVSGGADKNDLKDLIRRSYPGAEIFLTTGKEDDKKVSEKIKSNSYQRVVVAGGDGTIALVANSMHYSGIPLGIIPAGSANGLASELSIPTFFDKALEKAIKGEGKPFDIIEVNKRWHVLHMADFGLNASLVRRYQNDDHRGFLGYAISGLKELPNLMNINSFQMKVGNETHQMESNFVILANARQYGTGIEVNPKGRVDDGKFEVCCLQHISFEDYLRHVVDERTFEFSPFKITSAKQVAIQLKEPTDFQVDGEYIGTMDKLQAEILSGAVRLVY
ncbi:MAG: diacylglycerol kinase family protein [Cyclobacteriaceae bacterium]